MPEAPLDALVVGGGLAGATFALAAARAGRRVLVLDREQQPGHLPYPEVIWGGAWRALEEVCATDALRRHAVPLRDIGIFAPTWRSRRLHVDRRDLERAGVEAFAVKSAALRRLLLRLAQESGAVEVRSRTRVVRLLREEDRVVGVVVRDANGVEASLRAPLVVGADGPRSVVRRELGLDFVAPTFPLEFIVRYVPRPADLPEGHARAVLDPDGFRRKVVATLVVPAPDSEVGVILFARPGTYAALAGRPDAQGAFAQAIERVWPAASHGLADSFPDAFGQARRPVGHAPAYARSGAVLVGDAAHPVSPVGGQGADMAILDALSLVEHALRPAPQGRAPTRAGLAAYEEHRRTANVRGLRFSMLANRWLGFAWRAPVVVAPLPIVLGAVDRVPALRRAFMHHESRASLARDE